MPRRNDIKKVLIIGSGPIIIGQACEFDYSGTQACKALRGLGYQIVLVNSNPATIMTDPGMADATYIEPLTVQALTKIIEKERPDALLPNLGGQTALNLSSQLAKAGVLAKYGVRIIGVDLDAIEKGEDRIIFKETMKRLGIDMPQSSPAFSVAEAEKVAAEIGYPVVVRPAYTMGGTGGGFVYNVEELRVIASRGISASFVGQILIEESVLGWEELELEVVRDTKNQLITVCFIENVDAMGVHTGDSYCVAPMLTIDPKLQARLQDYSYRIVEAIGVIGGTNIQFAHDPKTGRVVIIEINPRTSRSSALASKATGFPIALVSAKLAGGLTLDEIPYWRDGSLEKYTPSGDYVVVKFSRWAFEKFKGSIDKLGTQMRAVGEVMSIGKTYKEAFQKAIRSLENGRHGLGFAKDFNQRSLPELMTMLNEPSSERQWIMYEALRKGATVEELFAKTYIKPWFIRQMQELVELEEQILRFKGKELPDDLLVQAKKDGFADKYLSRVLGVAEAKIRDQRKKIGCVEAWDALPVSGVDNAAYYYSTYNRHDRVPSSSRKKVMVLGGGPNRIGQGIEFDYCCVHAAFALKELGWETIMVNSNPETVSTDYDTSDKLYFEPLTLEDVLNIYERERADAIIVQFGGQTPLNLAAGLHANGCTIIGTQPSSIEMAEDRKHFSAMLDKLGLRQTKGGTATNEAEAVAVAARIGYPVLVRPSFVLGGRAMEIVHDEADLRRYIRTAVEASPERPVLVDRFLEDATEVDVDCIADGETCVIGGVMEHIEQAGIHSGDSACVIPSFSLAPETLETIKNATKAMARELDVRGLMNVQFAVKDGDVYILEVNPRASRTVPFVSKAIGVPLAKMAAKIMAGKTLRELGFTAEAVPAYYSVKEAVFPFIKFPGVDIILGPEMRSTGEVMGIDADLGIAYAKSQMSAQPPLPTKGNVFISVKDGDKPAAVEVAKDFVGLGFTVHATSGTAKRLAAAGIPVKTLLKIQEGRPNVLDLIKNGDIHFILNTPSGRQPRQDEVVIRSAGVAARVATMTTLRGARSSVAAIRAIQQAGYGVKSLQEYHAKPA